MTAVPARQSASMDEAARMAAVLRYEVLDTPPDDALDHITALAASLVDAPIAVISIVDQGRIWFKSRHGLDMEEIGRDHGLCAATILGDRTHVVPDALKEAWTQANPLVAGPLGLRFYAGAPLRTPDGYNLGALCVIDRRARSITERQAEQLEHLASVVMDQLELRRAARAAGQQFVATVAERDAALQRAETMAKEIEHRVMNSLQLVAGLLNLQSRSVAGTPAAEQLKNAAARIAAVARVHRHFALDSRIDRLPCVPYLRNLVADLSEALTLGVAFEAEGEATLPSASIVSLGLIVNELVTNSVKHGAGMVRVAFRADAAGLRVSVSDEGPGLPDQFETRRNPGLGMRIVRTLTHALRGRVTVGKGDGGVGARFTIALPPSRSEEGRSA